MNVIGEFGKTFSGAGVHIIRTLGDRKRGRAFWEVRNKISTKAWRCERPVKLQRWGKARVRIYDVRAGAFDSCAGPRWGWGHFFKFLFPLRSQELTALPQLPGDKNKAGVCE